MTILLCLLLLVVLIAALRKVLLLRSWPALQAEAFNGAMLALGDHLLCIPDRSHLPAEIVSRTTVICFPGFLEDVRYFLEVHRDTPARLILINNANYHNPFHGAVEPAPAWFTGNPHPLGTIAHDAYCMNQVIEHMTGAQRVVLHGHSRGGAVVLEAGNQRPDLAQRVEAVLEAAVVPRGRLYDNGERKLQPVGFYLFPLLLSLLRIVPESARMKSPLLRISTPVKRKIIAAIPFTPRRYATAVINSANIIDWQATTDYRCYERFAAVTLFVGESDVVLCRTSMLKSAAQCAAVRVMQTNGTDHFISLESPDTIRAYFS